MGYWRVTVVTCLMHRKLLIRSAGLKVKTFPTAQEIIAILEEELPSCLVLDVQLPGVNGFELQQQLAEKDLQVPIIFLTGHFIDLSVKEFGCARPILTKLGLEILQQYDWPGNIPELRNVIERAVILAQGGLIAFDVPGNGASIDPAAPKQTGSEREEAGFLTETEIRRRECENLFVVLQKTGWKIKGADGAARLLGVKPTTLISRIKRMGLVRPV
jgi:DNA-binding NtrC family response regulator